MFYFRHKDDLIICIILFVVFVLLATLFALDDNKTNAEQLKETGMVIGKHEPCVARITRDSWETMNDLGIYRWIAACEESLGI